MAIWHLGEGRHKEKVRAAALPRKRGAGFQVFWTHPLPHSGSPRTPPRIREKSVRAQAQPLAHRWALSLLGWGAGVRGDVEATPPSRRPECNRQHNGREGGKGQESRISSQEAQGPQGPGGQGAASKW